MFPGTRLLLGTISIVSCLTALAANAATIDFATALPAGDLQQSMTLPGLTVTAWEVSKANVNSWSDDAILNNSRQQPDALGLRVAALDNNGRSFGVIRLDLGAPVLITSIGLASLDGGDGFAIYGSNADGQPDFDTMIAIVSGTNQDYAGEINPDILVNQALRFIFIVPLNRGTGDEGSNFRLRSVTTESAPEPAGMELAAAGLLLFALLIAYRERRVKSKDP